MSLAALSTSRFAVVPAEKVDAVAFDDGDDPVQTPPASGGFDAAKLLWVLAVSAFAARLALVVLLHDWDASTAMEHASLARGLVEGNGFAFNEAGAYTQHGRYEPSSVQSPPYPLLLAGLFEAFGVDSPLAYFAAQVINCLAGAATVPLVYLMVRRLRGPPAAALTAAALMAVWPTQIFAVAFVQAISLITLCTVAVVVLWYRSVDTGRLLPWLAFGLIGCVAALTEPVLLPAMALAGLLILCVGKLPWPLRLRNAAVLLACAFVVIGPWTYRNYAVHGALMPIKSTFWVNVWKGNNPNSAGTDRPALSEARLAQFQAFGNDEVRQYDFLSDEQKADLDGANTVKRERLWKEYATDFIEQHPGRYAELCGIRLAKTLWWEWDNPKGHQALFAYPITRAVLLLGSLIGLLVVIGRRWRIGWPAVIVGTSLLTYTLTVTAARFALPLEPFQFALSAAALWWAYDRYFAPRRRPPVVQRFARSNDGR